MNADQIQTIQRMHGELEVMAAAAMASSPTIYLNLLTAKRRLAAAIDAANVAEEAKTIGGAA